MSKIEKALKRAGDERGDLQLVAAAAAGGRPASWTALLGQQIENPETIPRMAENEGRLLSTEELWERGIIHPRHTEEPAVQVFRELRTKIIQQNHGQNAVILVVAVSKGNGASFIARNLGAAFAFDSAKTALLVDCNLINPSVHRLLPSPSLPGLADYYENPTPDGFLARTLPRALHHPRWPPDVGYRRFPDPLRTVRLRVRRCAPRT